MVANEMSAEQLIFQLGGRLQMMMSEPRGVAEGPAACGSIRSAFTSTLRRRNPSLAGGAANPFLFWPGQYDRLDEATAANSDFVLGERVHHRPIGDVSSTHAAAWSRCWATATPASALVSDHVSVNRPKLVNVRLPSRLVILVIRPESVYLMREDSKIGIILNGVTGVWERTSTSGSILAIVKQGGVKVSNDLTLMPDPILTGRNPQKLADLAKAHGVARFTTEIQKALDDPQNEIFFDASSTLHRSQFIEMAVKARKAIYCEKPTAATLDEAMRLYNLCHKAGLKNGVVQDKLWLPGVRRLKQLIDGGFFTGGCSSARQLRLLGFHRRAINQLRASEKRNYAPLMVADHPRYVLPLAVRADKIFGPGKPLPWVWRHPPADR
jgi:hypothetical protein